MEATNALGPFLKSGNGRVFIGFPSAIGKELIPHGNMRIDSTQRQKGSVQPFYCGDEIIGYVLQKGGAGTATATGRIPAYQDSLLKQAFDTKCLVDVHIYYGNCVPVGDFETAEIYEDVIVTDYSTAAATALESGENAVVNETATFTFRHNFRINNVAPQNTIDNWTIVALDYVEPENPQDCPSTRSGTVHGRIYALAANEFGSPTWRILWSDDLATTWQSASITGMTDTDTFHFDSYSIAYLGDNTLLAASVNSLRYIPVDRLINGASVTPTNLTIDELDGIIAGGIKVVDKLLLLTQVGEIYAVDRYTNLSLLGTTAHSVSERIGIVGDPFTEGKIYVTYYSSSTSKVVEMSSDGSLKTIISGIDSAAHVTALGHNSDTLFIATDAGNMYAWKNNALVLVYSGNCVHRIEWIDDVVGILLSSGGIWMTLDGGNSWYRPVDINESVKVPFYLSVKHCLNKIILGGFTVPIADASSVLSSGCVLLPHSSTAVGHIWREAWNS